MHRLNLADAPFGKIKAESKVIESRLYDEKRRAIKLGDTIVFVNLAGEEIVRRVAGLYRYPTFDDMFADFEPSLFGGDSVEALSEEIHKFYSREDVQKYSVLGIRLARK